MESNVSTQHQANEILSLLNNAKPKQEAKSNNNSPTEVRQLFIGNLPFRVRWQDIKDLFRKAGHVVRANVALNQENRSKGHGTVLFATVEDAQKAIDMFNNYKWQGRIIEVRGDRGFIDSHAEESSPNQKDDNRKLVSPSSSTRALSPAVDVKKGILAEKKKENLKKHEDKEEENEEDNDCKQLFIGNLPFHCQWQDLKDLFRNSGRILRADVVLNFDGRSRGFGTVLFSSHEDAKNAIEQYNGFEFHSRILRVHFDKFAATHAKLREHEANTFGQRQIHDPESIELLRQTYLPQHPSIPLQPPPPPPMQYGYMMSQQPYPYYGHTSYGNLDMYQDNRMHSPAMNNSFGYQHSPSLYATNTNTTTTTTNNIDTTTTTTTHNNPMYGYPTQQQQWIQPPYYQTTDNNNDINSLSTSLNNLDIHNTTNPNLAGLNKEKDW